MQHSFLPFTSALSGASSPSRFVAIYMDASDGGQFLSITPKMMRWTANVYLLDLSPVLNYWSHLAEQDNASCTEYVSSLLLSLSAGNISAGNISAGNIGKDEINRAPCFIFATHPWQALLLLSVAMERPALKFIEAQSHLGRRMMHDITWPQWLKRCQELREHVSSWALSEGGTRSGTSKNKSPRGLSETKTSGTLSMLTKTISRMHLTLITQMSDIEPAAMHRRFGKLAATAWTWTWGKAPMSVGQQPYQQSHQQPYQQSCQQQPLIKEELSDDLFLSDFPWQNVVPPESPSIGRHMETYLRQWAQIEPLLCEDLDKICTLACWTSSERVVSLEWVLSFSCSPPLPILVLFRHPHALHRESGHHKTALLQAFHSWQKATKQHLSPEILGDTYIADDTITDWTLTIKERLLATPTMRSLFSDDLTTESSQLLRIENSVAVPLIGYAITDHWCPERSFVPASEEYPSEAGDDPSKFATHQRRPLFIYDQPMAIPNKEQSSGLIFCERVATTWWSNEHTNKTGPSRDYYIRMTNDGLLQWVFQNNDGHLVLHGLFG